MWGDIRCMMGTFYSADVEMPLLWSRGQSVASHLAWPCWSQLYLWLVSLQLSLQGLHFPHGGRVERQRRLRKHARASSVWSLTSLENSDEKAGKENPVLTAGGNENQCSHCGNHWGSKTLELEPPCDPFTPLVYDGHEASISSLDFLSSNLSHNLCPSGGWHRVRKVDRLLLSDLVS